MKSKVVDNFWLLLFLRLATVFFFFFSFRRKLQSRDKYSTTTPQQRKKEEEKKRKRESHRIERTVFSLYVSVSNGTTQRSAGEVCEEEPATSNTRRYNRTAHLRAKGEGHVILRRIADTGEYAWVSMARETETDRQTSYGGDMEELQGQKC